MIQSDPVLPPGLVERILTGLGLTQRPKPNLAGLSTLYDAWSGHVPFDNIRKRIWFDGDRKKPAPGLDPFDFFESWLTHGTGGTCWPTASALYALAHSLAFEARRSAGAMSESGEIGTRAGHGTVLVALEGVDYLVDPSMLAFEPLPLITASSSATCDGIHAIRAVPLERGFDVYWRPGHSRDRPAQFRTLPEHDPVDHAFFVAGYDLSTESGPFNDAVCACRRTRDSIVTVGRKNRIAVNADGVVSVAPLTDAERVRVLIDEIGLSEKIVDALPRDMPRADE